MSGTGLRQTFALWRGGAPGAVARFIPATPLSRDWATGRCACGVPALPTQDTSFWCNFARAWSAAVVKSERWRRCARCAATVNAWSITNGLHIGSALRMALTRNTFSNGRGRAELAYYPASFWSAGLQGDFPDLMAALAPASWDTRRNRLICADLHARTRPIKD